MDKLSAPVGLHKSHVGCHGIIMGKELAGHNQDVFCGTHENKIKQRVELTLLAGDIQSLLVK